MRYLSMFYLLVSASTSVLAQEDASPQTQLGGQLLIDSTSTIIIPVLYDNRLISFKSVLFDHYANIIFYDYKTESIRKLFEHNVFILPPRINSYYYASDS